MLRPGKVQISLAVFLPNSSLDELRETLLSPPDGSPLSPDSPLRQHGWRAAVQALVRRPRLVLLDAAAQHRGGRQGKSGSRPR